jgi:hypothetical protein
MLEALEGRTLMAVSVRAGVLTIVGSNRPDTVVVSLSAPDLDRIVVTEGRRTRAFDLAKITSISANGGRGNDLIELDQGNGQILLPTTLLGGDGNDTMIGGGGPDRIDGQAGHDRLRGQSGNDLLIGGLGDDDLDGWNGNDVLQGDDGRDILWGAAGNDMINGGAGDDELAGGPGNDQVTGGLGDDLFDTDDLTAGEVQDEGAGGSDETEVALGDAPQAVQDAINNLVGDRSLESVSRLTTGNSTTYEAEFIAGGLERSAILAENGAVLEQDIEVDPLSLPTAVFDAIFEEYPDGEIDSAEFSSSAAGDVFEIEVDTGDDGLHELTMSTAGAILTDVEVARIPEREPARFRDFTSDGVVPYFNLTVGTTLTLEGDDDGEFARVIITVLDAIKMIDGVETRIVEERETVDGELVEVSRNYFAIDRQTNNLNYFGEDVDDYEDGEIVDHEGAWRSGVRRAKFGLLLPGTAFVGLSYTQERAPGVALDSGQILSTTETVVTPAGTFMGCLRVRETSPLDPPGSESFKLYAPGIGLIQDDAIQLVSAVIMTP